MSEREITAESFWKYFVTEIQKDNQWSSYLVSRDRVWSDYILPVLGRVGKDLGFTAQEVSREYFRIDMCYFSVNSNDPLDWNLEVAIEHENGRTWMEEVCKLAHLAAQKKVLIAYYDYLHAEEKLEDLVEKAVQRINSRKYKTRPQSWIFIFGPSLTDISHSFRVFEYDAERDDEARELKDLEHKFPLKAA